MRDSSVELNGISCSASDLQPGDIITLTPEQYTRLKVVAGHREHVRLRQKHLSIAIVCTVRFTSNREPITVTVTGKPPSDIAVFTPTPRWVIILSMPARPFVLLEATENDKFSIESISHRAVIPFPVYALNVNDRFCSGEFVFHVTAITETLIAVNGGHDIIATVKAKQLPYVFDRQYNLITRPVAILPHSLNGVAHDIEIISESPSHRVPVLLSSLEVTTHTGLHRPIAFTPIDVQTLLCDDGLRFEDYCSAAARSHTMSSMLTTCVCSLTHPLLPVSTVDFFNNRPICIKCMLALTAASVFHLPHVVTSSVNSCIAAQQQLAKFG